jgi:hypothetical protein
MRHCARTKLILLVQVLFASGAFADEVADRIVMKKEDAWKIASIRVLAPQLPYPERSVRR